MRGPRSGTSLAYSSAMSRPPTRRQAGITLIEAMVAAAILSTGLLVAGQAMTAGARSSTEAIAQQRAIAAATGLLDRLVTELRGADPGSLLIDEADPSRLEFRRVVGAWLDGGVVQRQLTTPITLQIIQVPGSSVLAVERSMAPEDPEVYWALLARGQDKDATVSICHALADGRRQTLMVSLPEMNNHLNGHKSDLFGPCPSPPEILGIDVAPADADAPDLPGVQFDVRRDGDATTIGIVVTCEVPISHGEAARVRLQTTVALERSAGGGT